MFARIVFMQGDEGREVVDRLCNVDGVVAYGATRETMEHAIDYLSQWDYGDENEVVETLGHGTLDDVVEHGEYILAWNLGLGYVSLDRIVEAA